MYHSLLFLDFDGTYWPRCSENPRLFDEFARFVLRHSELAVVISSNWRLSHGLEDLRGYFHPDIENRVIGTLALEDDREPGVRQTLIEQYVEIYAGTGLGQGRGQPIRFVALDDNALLFNPAWAHLVLCDYSEGMTPAVLEEVSRRLAA